MKNWINVKERLPAEDKTVIILTPYWKEYVSVRYRSHMNAFIDIYDGNRTYDCSEIHAWCPIPKYDLEK